MSKGSPNRSILGYFDYRHYLKDECGERKKRMPAFSYRYISSKIGIRSGGFFSSVLLGKRNISEEHIHRLARFLKMGATEHEYFSCLVHFNQAKDHEERRFYLEKCVSIVRRAKGKTATRLEMDQFEYYDKWYNSVIRELAVMAGKNVDFETLANAVCPRIEPPQARQSLDLLLRLGLIKRARDGGFTRASKAITSGSSLKGMAVHNFQTQTIRLAQQALNRIQKNDRDISTITMSIDESTFDLMKQMLARFRANIIEIACSVQEPTRVFHLNLQLFPVSNPVNM